MLEKFNLKIAKVRTLKYVIQQAQNIIYTSGNYKYILLYYIKLYILFSIYKTSTFMIKS